MDKQQITLWQDAGYPTVDAYLDFFDHCDDPKPEPQRGDVCNCCEGSGKVFVGWITPDVEQEEGCSACDGYGEVQDVEYYNDFQRHYR